MEYWVCGLGEKFVRQAMVSPSSERRSQEKTFPPASLALIQVKPRGSESICHSAGCSR